MEVREQISRIHPSTMGSEDQSQAVRLAGQMPLTSHFTALQMLTFLICVCFVLLLCTLKALCRAEDEEDIRAATQAKAEQVAELAEFNENDGFPAGEGEETSRPGAEEEEMSRAEQEIAALVEQVSIDPLLLLFICQNLCQDSDLSSPIFLGDNKYW